MEWIHILEFKAVIKALRALSNQIRGCCVRLWCDNTTVVNCYKKGYSPKADIRTLLKEIDGILRTQNASLVVQWISTKHNIAADTLSRVNIGDSYRLSPSVFSNILELVGELDIDRFATATNKLLPKFNSYFWEEGCAGIDAFA